ncbi:DUF2161 domain-containing phosphodiesterase [Oceanospirillum sediminis]|uniref:DUF2161 domain-containing phosphodiesterase n=1 Tax=Oceanospirillum sediminis TaxID=2760088 RepID=A0A839IQ92_9GAMM|nr:DUF2161 family putative PD-(D/E)XK-type phosphodiesterase [Oceanospirillum sediminis]MBB1486844.1 hypothetical protein [Oceanospirillum sediminis]
MKETDLYLPVKRYLQSQGYDVKGEVQHCDVVAIRRDELPVIVELKLALNLNLVLQAVDRLALSSTVYVAVPSSNRLLRQQRKRVLKLFRMLGLGLITVDTEAGASEVTEASAVDVLLDPGAYQPRESRCRQQRLLGEFEKRVGDPDQGGADPRKGRITAYRQQALAIADYLTVYGPAKASDIAYSLNNPKTRDILYRNVYGWFERGEARGIYCLSPRGERELPEWKSRVG